MVGSVILIAFGIFFIIWGVLYLDEKRYKKLVNWSAEMRGVKPQITSKTLSVGKLISIIYIVLGVGLILAGLWLNSFLTSLSVL